MTEITRRTRIGFHYNGFLTVLDNSNPAYDTESPIKNFKKIHFCSNCGTWVKSLWIESYDNPQTGALAADWILLSRNEKILNMPTLKSRASQPYADLSKISLWTDDHINLLQILK